MTFLAWGRVQSGDTIGDGGENLPAVRNTARESPVGAPAAMEPDAPSVNAAETDSNPELGLSYRTLAGYWHPKQGQQPLNVTQYDAAHAGSNALDESIPDKGTAAERERAGEWGPGTQQWAESLEPAIHDASFFGMDYFAAEQPGAYVSQPGEGIEPRHDASRQDIMNAYTPGTTYDVSTDQWAALGAYYKS